MKPKPRPRWLRILVIALFPWREIYRLNRILDKIADTPVYPKKIIGGPHAYDKRSNYMIGWNDAQESIFHRWCEALNELNGNAH